MRTRGDIAPLTTGYLNAYDSGGNLLSQNPSIGRFYEHRIDDWGPGYNSPGDLYIDKIDRPIVNHSWPSGDGHIAYEGNYVYPGSLSHIPLGECILDFPDDDTVLATRVAARSNPSTPIVSLPQFIGDLRDLPRDVYKRGSKGIEMTRGNLDSVGIRFGILPMVSDVVKLMNFHDSVQKRTRTLDELASGVGTRKKVKLGSGTKVQPTGPNIFPTTEGLAFASKLITRWDVWGVGRWKPANGYEPPPFGSPELSKMARSLVLGVSSRNDIYSYMRDAWEILPWSWMADWFGNVGDYLDANRNLSTFQPESIWVMRRAQTTKITTGPLGTYKLTHVTKQRTLGHPALAADVGILSPDQMSILTGLALKDRRHKLPPKFR